MRTPEDFPFLFLFFCPFRASHSAGGGGGWGSGGGARGEELLELEVVLFLYEPASKFS
jgi:hypothetical protein